jgi:hypothetical protein
MAFACRIHEVDGWCAARGSAHRPSWFARVSAVRRLVRVLLTAGLTLTALLLAQSSAFAYIGERGDPHPLGLVNIILIFVGGPVTVFVIVAALCLRPQKGAGAQRYRPGRAWSYPTAWFGTRPPVNSPQQPVGASPGGASGSW